MVKPGQKESGSMGRMNAWAESKTKRVIHPSQKMVHTNYRKQGVAAVLKKHWSSVLLITSKRGENPLIRRRPIEPTIGLIKCRAIPVSLDIQYLPAFLVDITCLIGQTDTTQTSDPWPQAPWNWEFESPESPSFLVPKTASIHGVILGFDCIGYSSMSRLRP